MGYYSDVMFAFYPTEDGSIGEVVTWVEQHWPKAWCTAFEYDDMITIKYDSVKWYDDAEFVVAAWAAIRKFEEAFGTEEWEPRPRANWEMVRIGEDDGDTERGGSMYREYRLGIRREIEVY